MALTDNAIPTLLANIDQPVTDQPILQVLHLKKLPSNGGERTRVVLSDGVYFMQGMLASQLTESIQTNSIVQLQDYMVNNVRDRKVVILLKIAVIQATAQKIGDPMDIEKAGGSVLHNATNSAPSGAASTASYPKPNTTGPYGGGGGAYNNNATSSPLRSPRNPYGSSSQSSATKSHAPIMRQNVVQGGNAITSINSLNMYNNRWTIRARITNKSDVRTWTNAKSEGTLFSIDMLDQSGDIKGTFFKECVDKYYNMIEVNKVYTISGGRLKVANQKWNTCKSQYEITFDMNTEIHLADDDRSIQYQNYEFVKIADIQNMAEKSAVDVLAVVKSVSEPTKIVSKKNGRELLKATALLMDDSGFEIQLTLWAETAQSAQQQLSGQPVVAFRKCRVSDFGGKSLNGGNGMDVHPQLPQAQALAAWWQSNADVKPQSLSRAQGATKALTERDTISMIADQHMGTVPDKTDWVTFKGCVTFIKKDKEGGAWYPACANAGDPCNNRFKATQTVDGNWHCDRCNQTFPKPVRRWIFSAILEDHTSSNWVSFFNEQAEVMFDGKTADEIHDACVGDGGFDGNLYEGTFLRAQCREFIFKCKVIQNTHNDETRAKTSVYGLSKIDWEQESRDLLAAIETF